MNPPFGEPSVRLLSHLAANYSDINKNLLCAFLKQGFEMLVPNGRLGAIYDRTAVVKNTYEGFRRSYMVSDCRLAAVADLGWEVLDANVEVTTSIIEKRLGFARAIFLDARKQTPATKGEELLKSITSLPLPTAKIQPKCFAGTDFARFPNAVLGYDFPSFVIKLFESENNLRGRGVQVIQGHTILAERYFRSWWELPLEDAFGLDSRWQRFYNGGEYCRFNSKLADAVLYGIRGELISNHNSTIFRNLELQQKGSVGFGKRGEFIDAHILPLGFVSSVEGQAVLFHNGAQPLSTLALLNSRFFQAVINLYCGQHKYPGYVHLFPCPDWSNAALGLAGQAAVRIFELKDRIESADETNPRFMNENTLPFLRDSFCEDALRLRELVSTTEAQLNDRIEEAYALDGDAKEFVREATRNEPPTGGFTSGDINRFWAESCVSFAIGCIFGRWDVAVATSLEVNRVGLDPFERLPVCPPAMLQNALGLPLTKNDFQLTYVEAGRSYPIEIAWDGIVAGDGPNFTGLEQRVHELFEVIWGPKADAIEQKVSGNLGRRSLREYLQQPAGFFADHLKNYSKARPAPIYWPLSTRSGTYTLWLYYPRLNSQTLHTCLADFLDPRLKSISDEIRAVRASSGSKVRLTELLDFEDELKEMRTEIERVVKLPYEPNLNDGVLVTASPLWKLFRLLKWQAELRSCWQELEQGEYDWAHLAYSIWPGRVKERCETDRSIAVAHGLENLCSIEETKPKPKRGRKKAATFVEEDAI